ncbi:MAG: hypothetical protein K0S57_1356 [Ramlibacter sp.]|jgi:hypothetical protein|nr:hypothetical protein [Ramlibacter sp.]
MNVREPLDLLPVRQLVGASGDAAEAFASQALLDALCRPGKYRVMRHGQGAQILAANEFALAEAQAMLGRAYGALVTFGEPGVHTWLDAEAGALMVPVVYLRIDAPRSHWQDLLQLLADRSAQSKQADLQRRRVVVRAEMELSRSMGVTRQVGEVTDGAAQVLSWLTRYQPAGVSEGLPPSPLGRGPG